MIVARYLRRQAVPPLLRVPRLPAAVAVPAAAAPPLSPPRRPLHIRGVDHGVDAAALRVRLPRQCRRVMTILEDLADDADAETAFLQMILTEEGSRGRTGLQPTTSVPDRRGREVDLLHPLTTETPNGAGRKKASSQEKTGSMVVVDGGIRETEVRTMARGAKASRTQVSELNPSRWDAGPIHEEVDL